jgi:filamentous hemagglutinin
VAGNGINVGSILEAGAVGALTAGLTDGITFNSSTGSFGLGNLDQGLNSLPQDTSTLGQLAGISNVGNALTGTVSTAGATAAGNLPEEIAAMGATATISAGVQTAIEGGSFLNNLKTAGVGDLAAVGAFAIGNTFDGSTALLSTNDPAYVLAHAALGCAASAALGTGCAGGAIGGAVSAGLNPLISSATNGQLNPAAMTAISMIASGTVAGALGYNVQGATTAAENETLNNFCEHNSCGQALSTFLSKVSNGIDTAINAGADVPAQDSATNLDLLRGIGNTTLNASTFSLPGMADYVPYFSYSNPTIGSIGELYGAVGLSEIATSGVSGTVATNSTAVGALPAPPAGTVQAWSGSITAGTVPDGGMTAYRIWGGGSTQAGSWLSPIPLESTSAAQSLLALPPANAAEFISTVQIPGGTQIQFGTAASAFGQTGGGIQIQLLQRIPLSSFGPGVPLPK